MIEDAAASGCRASPAYRTIKQFLRSFHLSSLDELPAMPDMGNDGQMRLNEVGEVVDAAEGVEPDTERTEEV